MTIRKTLLAFCVLLLTLPFAARLTGAATGKLSDAISLYEKGSFKQAVELLRQEAKAYPRDAEIRFWLGKAYLKVQDWKAAVEEMEKAVELEPSNARYHHWLGRASGERAGRAFVTTAYSMAKQVVKSFETARKLSPEDLSIRFDLLEYYLQAPGMLGGGKDKAEAEARAIAEIDRRKGYAAWANIHKKDKQWDRAKAELLRAAEEFPESAAACEDLADYLFWRQDYEGALQWSRRALTLNPRLNYSRFLAAAAATRLNRDLEAAGGEFQALANGSLSDDDPTFDQVYYHLGENYLARGDKAKAKEAFQSALSYNPENSRARDALKKL
ncbi:MAG: tetratricopeptide repeat protein [Acidobacteriota bacterium]|nr:tetratricopeptide repeat protein [Acidobacteriota bacterium]